MYRAKRTTGRVRIASDRLWRRSRRTRFGLFRGRAISVAGLLVAFCGVNVCAATTVAIYHGSHIETVDMQQNNSADSKNMQQAMGAATIVYASSDAYEKIYFFTRVVINRHRDARIHA